MLGKVKIEIVFVKKINRFRKRYLFVNCHVILKKRLEEVQKMEEYQNIDEYINQFSGITKERLIGIRALVKEIAPEATEKISYGIPTFYLNGNLVHFAGYKTHIGFYPGAKGVAAFLDDVEGKYKYSKGTIQFPLNEEMPMDLIGKIVSFRTEENRLK